MKKLILLLLLLLVGCSNPTIQSKVLIQGNVRSIPYISDECQVISDDLRNFCIENVNSIECKSSKYDWEEKCQGST